MVVELEGDREGFVSLWVGNVPTTHELDRLLAVSYSDEGDFVASIFAKHFETEIAHYSYAGARFFECPGRKKSPTSWPRFVYN